MRTFGGLALAVLLSSTPAASAIAAPLPAPGPYHSGLEVDISLFHDDLSPYGQWLSDADYGPVWVPAVSHDWRPYTRGQWVWTDEYGWLWQSSEPYGWATCHYGRWDPSPHYGWARVPRYARAPASGSVRTGGGYAGWAPLPPSVGWDASVGFRVGGSDFDRYVDPYAYSFVPERHFLDPVPRYVVPSSRNVTLVRDTQNVTNFRVVDRRP